MATSERKIVDQALDHLRSNLPGSVVIKHNDIGTKGIPDIQVERRDRTCWGEFKLLRRGDTLKGINKAQQLVFCHELATVCNGRSWVFVYEEPRPGLPACTTIWQPRVLFAHLWPNVAGPAIDHPGWIQHPPLLWNRPATDGTLIDTIRARGAARILGWHYDLFTQLVLETV